MNNIHSSKTMAERYSGVLLHISSLASNYGIGTLGKSAYQFADFLDAAGQKYWQVLPVGPTGYGDSPYQSFSTFAGNPYFIDLDILVEEGLLTQQDIARYVDVVDDQRVDYNQIYQSRYPLLSIAYANFDIHEDAFNQFKLENDFWLNDYALYMTLKKVHHGQNWLHWPQPYRLRDATALAEFTDQNEDEINFQCFMQYLFFKQWHNLKNYVNQKHIQFIGDIPIYVAEDSADVWTNPELFQLNEDLSLKYVGGCPPDGFAVDGQLWGNPVYDWQVHKDQNYAWWVKRIKWITNIFDIVRIDHFRGFESYWRVPAGDKTAKNGSWQPGPGIALFNQLKQELGLLPIIAEDLGYMTKEVHQLREATGFPSMKVLQFAFEPNGRSEHIPHNYHENIIVYPGTHDSYTVIGWQNQASAEEVAMAKAYFGIADEAFHWGMIRGAMTSVAKTVITQMQDLLGYDNRARMNEPSILGRDNWCWRMHQHAITEELINRLYTITKMTNRLKDKHIIM